MRRHLDRLRLRLRSLFGGHRVDRDLGRELRAHLDEEIAANEASGMNRDEARRAAGVAFGSIASIEEQCRETRQVSPIEHVMRDLRLAVRALVRQPGAFAASAASIAIGVGANLTIFALANNLLLAVPSAAHPGSLVNIRTGNGSHVSFDGWRAFNASGALDGVAGYQFEQSVNWRDGDDSIAIVPFLVTANYFDVVGVPVQMGRGFTAADVDRDPHAVVISHGFWRRRLASDPRVVGQSLVINGEPYTIAGVLPDAVRGIAGFGLAPEVYLPLSRALAPSITRPHAAYAQLVGRLRPGQTVAAGRAALAAVAARTGEAEGDVGLQTITAFERVGGVSQADEFRALAAFLVVLLVVSSLVLAIACANVAGLNLARGLTRHREIALSLAVGASRGRLIQQLLIENLVLAAAGTLAGIGLTALTFILLSGITLPLPLPVEVHFALDWRIGLVAIALVTASTCLAGLAPALQAGRAALVPAIKAPERHFFLRGVTMRRALVAGQMTVSLVLLVAALIFARNLTQAASVDPGFDLDHVLVAQLSFVEGRQGTAAQPAASAIVDRLRGVPGVDSAAFSEGVPLTIFSGSQTGTNMRIEGRGDPMRVDFDSLRVGPGYFRSMGIRLVRGRDFTDADRAGGPAVVIINEEFARRYFAGIDPQGRHIAEVKTDPASAEIIGVVANSKYRSLAETRDPATYEPLMQAGARPRFIHVLIRTRGLPESLMPAVRRTILAADGSAALTPMREAMAFALLPSRLASGILGLLGVMGTLLAMIGLFGVVSFTVNHRAREIAIRIALGASRSMVMRLVLQDALRLVAVGVVAGLLLASVVMTPLAAFLVAGVSPLDPASFAAATGLLAVAALVAIVEPLRRAMATAPGQVLKLD
jgi:predicted permease